MVQRRSAAWVVLATLSSACSLPGESVPLFGAGGSTGGGTSSGGSTRGSSTGGATESTASTGGEASTSEAGGTTVESPKFDLGGAATKGGGDGCSKIDFLFAIDTSGWMDESYPGLEAALPHFIEAIDEVFPNVDLHIMVANTSGEWGTWQCPINLCSLEKGCEIIGEPDYPCDVVHEIEEMPECDRALGAGVTFPAGIDATNERCEIVGDRRYLTREEPDLMASFLCIASQGHAPRRDATGWGSGRALSYELGLPGGCNEGFLREDAHLVVTTISYAGSYEGGYNPKVWADTVIDSKGDQEAVSLIAMINDPRLPGAKCPESAMHQLYSYAEYFEHRLVRNLCDETFEEDFDAGLEMVREQCEAAL